MERLVKDVQGDVKDHYISLSTNLCLTRRKGTAFCSARNVFIGLGVSFTIFAVLLIHNISVRRMKGKENVNVISVYSFPDCGRYQHAECQGDCNLHRSRRLVGGTRVKDIWPWMAEILVENRHYCGGVLISAKAILTAAHCVYEYKERLAEGDMLVRLGLIDRLKPTSRTTVYAVELVVIHEKYDPSSLRYDTAIITLKREAALGNTIWPICLPTSSLKDIPIEMAKVAGWGRRFEGGEFTEKLHEINIPLASIDKCKQRNNGIFKNVNVSEELNLCAGFGGEKKEYGCKGDSGGPLITQVINRYWVVLGIMSWGDPTCLSSNRDTYTVFSRINVYENWISKHVY